MKTKGWFNRKARKCMHQGLAAHQHPADSTPWIIVRGHDPSFGKMWECVGCNQRWYLY